VLYLLFPDGNDSTSVECSLSSDVDLKPAPDLVTNPYRMLTILLLILVGAISAAYIVGFSDVDPTAPPSGGDERLIPLRLPSEVGNSASERNLTRLSVIQTESELPVSSPIYSHGYWE
jgi:hypothetical protein